MIHVGTTNQGKLAEFAALLAPLGAELSPVSLNIPETTDSFDGNAKEKALAYAAHTGGLTIAEDSGLIIPALGGLPGPWSARFTYLDLTTRKVEEPSELPSREEIDRRNNERVLDLMRSVRQPHRAASFKVVLIVAKPGEVLFQTSGESYGWIAPEPRGSHGFGYDPIFVGQDTFDKTYAEIDPVRKNLRSHRTRALNELFVWLSQRLELL